ncbi:RNA 2',3'-cyclic phosphodiesterase [Bacillus sp. 165]|uniref:RNA 2',3'-cyclic phosphodiesterase n=1 Tax=Bacillus sp. 165 TaxID=1529117 RepID=UPI001ADBC518|nr:RNA 2',3'-cyclic phosphodiesterase [Bacillus sp. 165]MBO9130880.1 RNA 2',3'-cyclic phosphodiesterase [Bacillus sp. 165]
MAMHYFLALSLPNQIKKILNEWKQQQQLSFQSWVHWEDYHITLAFLGSAPPSSLHTIQQELEKAVYKWKPFSLQLQGLRTFGTSERPRVLWVDVKHSKELFTLQREVHTICEEAGVSLETRPYRPHITVARRWKGQGQLYDLQANEIEELYTASFSAEQLVLFETHPTETPKYKENFKISLHSHSS